MTEKENDVGVERGVCERGGSWFLGVRKVVNGFVGSRLGCDWWRRRGGGAGAGEEGEGGVTAFSSFFYHGFHLGRRHKPSLSGIPLEVAPKLREQGSVSQENNLGELRRNS